MGWCPSRRHNLALRVKTPSTSNANLHPCRDYPSGALTSLTQLGLGGNEMTGVLPTQLGRLSSLKYLALQSNQFTGTLATGVDTSRSPRAVERVVGVVVVVGGGVGGGLSL